MPGIAHGFHEGSRSEYLAAYVFSAFGTASAIPHQEDHGFDLYCTLARCHGKTRFAAKPFSVQVKSVRQPWVFDNRASVEWFIDHPLPMFLCVVEKHAQRIFLFQTTPKYYYWTVGGELPERLELHPNFGESQGECGYWQEPEVAALGAPILNFTLDQMNDDVFFATVRQVLDSWIDLEYVNLFQLATRTRQWLSPGKYRTNEPIHGERAYQSGAAATADEGLEAMAVLKHSLAWVMEKSIQAGDWPGATRVALLLRHFCRDARPDYAAEFCSRLNLIRGEPTPSYLFEALDEIAADIDAKIRSRVAARS